MNTTNNTTKAILITGCSSGIGLYLAQALNNMDSYKVLATCRQQEDIDKLNALGIECHYLELNSPESIETCFQWALKQSNNNIYGLINNAAYGQPGAVEDLSRDVLIEQFQSNVFGTHELTCKVLKHMREHNQGRIIQISSILGLCCLPFRGAYNASKYALEALTDTMRLELGKQSKIKISLIEPGPIRSDFRINALQKFNSNININNSYHKTYYKEQVSQRLNSTDEDKFTLEPVALLKPVLNALEKKNPRVRTCITTPAVIMSKLKRVLPDKMLEMLILSKFKG